MSTSAGVYRVTITEGKSTVLNKTIRSLGKSSKNNSLLKQIASEAMENDSANFLFVSSETGMIINGMHFPDSAFGDEEPPLIFRTSRENVLIAAWPQTIVKLCLEFVTANSDEDNLKTNWDDALDVLCTLAQVKIQNGQIYDNF
jgi:hypothetical protein